MATQLRPASRLRFGEKQVIDGVEFWDLLDLPSIPPQPDDIFHTVSGNDRVDTLANRFYEDPGYWWVIAVRNDMEILPTELNSGEEIVIPSPRYVRQVLFKNLTIRR